MRTLKHSWTLVNVWKPSAKGEEPYPASVTWFAGNGTSKPVILGSDGAYDVHFQANDKDARRSAKQEALENAATLGRGDGLGTEYAFVVFHGRLIAGWRASGPSEHDVGHGVRYLAIRNPFYRSLSAKELKKAARLRR